MVSNRPVVLTSYTLYALMICCFQIPLAKSLAQSVAHPSAQPFVQSPVPQPASSVSNQQWVDAAIADGAAFDPQWLRLGHWKRRRFWGRLFRSVYLSEADGPKFFLAADGKHDPEKELRATLSAFFEPPAKAGALHPQCQFPARFKWAKARLHIDSILEPQGRIEPCLERKAWKQRLGAEGLNLVFASAYLNNAASMFGHTFLKFRSQHNGSGRDLLDYGVSYAAETGSDGGVPFAVLGLTGGYEGHFSLQPFHQTLREYSNIEGRDLWEYKLNLTPDEIEFFIDHLFELEQTYFDYYFLTENCSYHLLSALEAAKPDLSATDEFWYHVIPADSVRVMAHIPGLIGEIRYRPSVQTLFQLRAESASRREIQDAIDLNSGDLDRRNHASQRLMLLTPTERSSTLDLAIDYGAVLAVKDPVGFEKTNYDLRVQRAGLGGSTASIDAPLPARPEEGHDPGRIGLLISSIEKPSGYQTELALQLRFAYHDRLSRDDGYLRGTTLEVLRTTVSWPNEKSGPLEIKEIAILDILSAQPRSAFSSPMSWRAEFGFKAPGPGILGARSLGPYVNGGTGRSFAIGPTHAPMWFSALLDGEALSNPDLAKQTPLSAGPRLIGSWFLTSRFRVGIDSGIHFPINGGSRQDWIELQIAHSLTKNFEWRLTGRDRIVDGVDQREWSLRFFQHVLF